MPRALRWPLSATDGAKRRPFIGSFFTVIRWNEWATSKIPLFFVCMYYAALSRPVLVPSVILELLGLLLILCLYAAVGYAINSLSDREVDRVSGKRDKLGEMPEGRVKAFLWLVFGASVVAPLLIYRDRLDVLALLALSYLLAAGYSLPPVRLKERGMLGLVASAVAQRTLPATLVFTAMQYWDWAAIGLCALGTIIGIRYIVVHQILDEAADRRSGVRTTATAHGGSGVRRILKWFLFPLEVGVAALTVALISMQHWVLVPVSLTYLLWLLVQYAVLRPGDERSRFSIASYYVLEDYYNFYLPVTLAVFLAVDDAAFWSVVGFTLTWRTRLIGRELRNVVKVGRRLLKAV